MGKPEVAKFEFDNYDSPFSLYLSDSTLERIRDYSRGWNPVPGDPSEVLEFMSEYAGADNE